MREPSVRPGSADVGARGSTAGMVGAACLTLQDKQVTNKTVLNECTSAPSTEATEFHYLNLYFFLHYKSKDFNWKKEGNINKPRHKGS